MRDEADSRLRNSDVAPQTRAVIERAIPAQALDRLRTAMSEHRAEGLSLTALTILDEICAEARRRGVPPEQIIVYVKDEIRSIPRLAEDRDHERGRLESAVTKCIRSFYASAPQSS